MFRALVQCRDVEGNQRHAAPEGEDHVSYSTMQEAAHRLVDNNLSGIITTLDGRYVDHV